ncbi:hypothetical protein ABZ912_30105 [Nonomuraea angiospora]|uniref:hypothetical protein n=1 Tax=Nonomuraea angiospora TaxID=46172 RepID=UPI0033D2C8A0
MNPHTLEARGQRDEWTITTEPHTGGRMLVLDRDEWIVQVAFDGSAPAFAQIRKPGMEGFQHLDRRDIARYVRGDRAAMSAFRIGDRAAVGERVGTVINIYVEAGSDPGRPGKVRLRVAYDLGGHADPYTTFATRLQEASCAR